MAESADEIKQLILRNTAKLRPHKIATVQPNIDHGRSHDIHIVKYQDGVKRAARIACKDDCGVLERRAIRILKHIKHYRPDCKIPRIHGHNLDEHDANDPLIFFMDSDLAMSPEVERIRGLMW